MAQTKPGDVVTRIHNNHALRIGEYATAHPSRQLGTSIELSPRAAAAIHSLPITDVYAALATRPHGLTAVEAAARLQRYGSNLILEIKGTPLIVKFLANFTHLMAILLWAGGLIAFIAQMPQLGIAIWTVNLINGAFGFWQEYKAEKATEAVKRLLPHYARVVRRQEQRIFAEELLRGGVLLLLEGDHISAARQVCKYAPNVARS
jgi:magnesium-transporting ATPase (P-type)